MEFSDAINIAPQVKASYMRSKKIDEILDYVETVAIKIFDLDKDNKNLKKCLKAVRAKLSKVD